MKKGVSALLFLIFLFLYKKGITQQNVIPGANRTEMYISLLKEKKVAVFANQTSLINKTHLIDTLLKRGINIIKIFAPEHGFRGNADAGEELSNAKDKATGIEVISLYGDHKKPTPHDLENVDVMLFDIQDVGVRFYTFISSLEYYIEASLENSIPLIILDRPNPNGFYIDGPVLDKKFKSFIGMQSIPIVYGMTIGEYAMMIAGEKWLSINANNKYAYYLKAKNSTDSPFHFLVIKCKNYDHKSKYILPVKPSPNLPEMQSIYWYPSTCFFEGTVMSEGRGTDKPFQLFGHPSLPHNLASFVPSSREGAKDPKLKDQTCYGWNLSGTPQEVLKKIDNKIQLRWILQAYKLFPEKNKFFISDISFNRLAGNDILIRQIKEDKSETEIRESWQPALNNFKIIRKKYLLYDDF